MQVAMDITDPLSGVVSKVRKEQQMFTPSTEKMRILDVTLRPLTWMEKLLTYFIPE